MRLSRPCTTELLSTLLCAAGLITVAAAQDSSTDTIAKSDVTSTRVIGGVWSPSNLNRVGVQTAQPVPITLQDAVRRALDNNNSIEVSRGDVRFQATRVRSLLGVYDPVLTAQPTFSRTSTTGGSPTRDFSVNADVFQFIRPGGGSYDVFFNNRRTENAFAQAQVTSGSVTGGNTALFSSSLGINYIQPLARNFRVDSRRHSITVAKKLLLQTDADFRTLVTQTLTQVQTAYWDFVFALRNQQNQVANVNLARENLRQVELRIQAGAAAPLERAEVATELATREGDLLLATQQVSIAENTLKGLILRDPLAPEWSETFVPTDPPTVSPTAINLDAALKDAMDNRYELRSLRFQREANEADLKFFKNQKKPQIDLNTTFSLDGLSQGGPNSAFNTTLLTGASDIFLLDSLNSTRAALGLPPIVNPPLTIPPQPAFLFGGFNRSLANIFRSDAPNFSIGVTISFPFRNRTAKANYDGAKVQQEQLQARTRGQEETVIIEVRNAVQAVETARQRVDTATRARQNAEIQLEGERKLYDAGKSTTFLLFQRENALLNAKNAEIRALTDYNKAIADLQRATATAFSANNITIQDPVPDLK
jgi:HAE1 family hydrophobic/amphiphilic exporter-1